MHISNFQKNYVDMNKEYFENKRRPRQKFFFNDLITDYYRFINIKKLTSHNFKKVSHFFQFMLKSYEFLV